MEQQRWQKIERILDEALSIENPEKQTAYIKKACKTDQKLLSEIQAMMQSIQDADAVGFMEIKR